MWKLYGVRNVCLGCRSTVVAYFTSDEDAEDYVRKSCLKHPVEMSDGRVRVFHKKSVLAEFDDAYVEVDTPNTTLPIDPVI